MFKKYFLMVCCVTFISIPSHAYFNFQMNCINSAYLDNGGEQDLLTIAMDVEGVDVAIHLTYLPMGHSLDDAQQFEEAIETIILSRYDISVPIRDTFEDLRITHKSGSYPMYRIQHNFSTLFELSGPVWREEDGSYHRSFIYSDWVHEFIEDYVSGIDDLPRSLRRKYRDANFERIYDLLPNDEEIVCAAPAVMDEILTEAGLDVEFRQN